MHDCSTCNLLFVHLVLFCKGSIIEPYGNCKKILFRKYCRTSACKHKPGTDSKVAGDTGNLFLNFTTSVYSPPLKVVLHRKWGKGLLNIISACMSTANPKVIFSIRSSHLWVYGTYPVAKGILFVHLISLSRGQIIEPMEIVNKILITKYYRTPACKHSPGTVIFPNFFTTCVHSPPLKFTIIVLKNISLFSIKQNG